MSVVLATACASTPDSRTSKKQSLFDTYPQEVQAKLRMGKVDVGYDEDMAVTAAIIEFREGKVTSARYFGN
jgi:hypothetical protein